MRPELELDLLCMKKGTAEAVPLVPVLLSVCLCGAKQSAERPSPHEPCPKKSVLIRVNPWR